MAGPERPQFVLFGSSIVQFSFALQGWGAILADIYARKADILMRGYAGWNSRQAIQVLDRVFPKDAAVKPSLVIVYFGGNDSVSPDPSGLGQHVPLLEYKENMRKIATHLKDLSEKIRIIFLTPPPVSEQMMRQVFMIDESVPLSRTNEGCRIYAEACLEISREMGIKCINLWTALQRRKDWLTACFTDGIHLTAEGSEIVAREILEVLMEADWEPSLHPLALPVEFEDISPFAVSVGANDPAGCSDAKSRI